MSGLKVLRIIILYLIGLFWAFFVTLQVIRLIITKKSKFFFKKNRTVSPDILQDEKYGVHNVQHINQSMKLHYVVSGSEDKPLMVMLHGFPEFWYSWRHQITEFKNDYRVVAVDLRGYGQSSKPSNVSDYTVDKLVGDIEQLLISLGSKKCILLGHDWGGVIAWALAAHHPELVEKVVIMNCPQPSVMLRYMRGSWTQFLKSWYMFFVNLPYYPEWFFSSGDLKMLENAFQGKLMGAKKGAFTREDLEAFKYTFNRKSDFTGPINYIRASVRGLTRFSFVNKKVPSSCPVLLIWGTRDGALNTAMAKLSAQYAEDFTLRFIEGASHWVQQDEPEMVNQFVKEFLSHSHL